MLALLSRDAREHLLVHIGVLKETQQIAGPWEEHVQPWGGVQQNRESIRVSVK